MVNSDFLNGYAKKKDSIERMLEELEKKGIGKAGVQYKMKRLGIQPPEILG